MTFLASILSVIGATAAAAGTQGCYMLILDEPKMPKSLIEK